jgi:hypothetical protein
VRSLALAVDGGGRDFPEPEKLREVLAFLEVPDLVPGQSLRPPAAAALRASLPGVRYPAVRNVFVRSSRAEDPPDGALWTLPRPEDRRRGVELAILSARYALDLGAPTLIVELGKARTTREEEGVSDLLAVEEFNRELGLQQNRLLDELCRALFEVSEAAEGIRIALTTPRPGGELPTLEIAELVLEDLGPRRIGYWHDAGRARALQTWGLTPEERWLDRLGPHCVGVDLSDCLGLEEGLPPGLGEVDFRLLREALGSSVVPALRCRLLPDAAALATAAGYLRGLGY